jgi:hypothetical protein
MARAIGAIDPTVVGLWLNRLLKNVLEAVDAKQKQVTHFEIESAQ